ncbi:MAG: DUF6179 domain-containing protein [Oscillospiraceae bacterium]
MDDFGLIPFSESELMNENISEDELSRLQLKIWRLLARRTGLYTMGDSSSVQVETAQELLASICFLLRLFIRESKSSLRALADDDAESVFSRAIEMAEKKIEHGKQLYMEASSGVPELKSLSLSDTLQSIGNFFNKYDYRYFAHLIPCDIDYQLCHAVPETLQGIEYVNEYLCRLIIENDIIRHFKKDTVVALLKAYCEDYNGLLINLCEPVLTNTIGLAMIHEDVFCLNIKKDEQARLCDLLQTMSGEQLSARLENASERLADRLEADDAATEYIKQAVTALYPRIEAAVTSGGLNGIFLSW